MSAFRTRARRLRIAAGAPMIVLALALAFNVTDAIQRALPDYASAARKKVEDSDAARRKTARRATVEVRPAAGIQACSFTFG
ncbi:hypothetical protein ABZY02_30760 [Streptomyces sp. NPDC006649]|uniref:hypothetical protein n=1 Tax=Streptomyces sp. NPDC006649 TaxID=3156896 RepID=UPI0033A03587